MGLGMGLGWWQLQTPGGQSRRGQLSRRRALLEVAQWLAGPLPSQAGPRGSHGQGGSAGAVPAAVPPGSLS